jgi:repressor LexA
MGILPGALPSSIPILALFFRLIFTFSSPIMSQAKPMALTRRQKQVLDFIAGFVNDHGYCPSFEEIGTGLHLTSLATVHKHISILEGKNYLKRGYNQSRSLELTAKYLQELQRIKPALAAGIPLRGRIAAGAPVEAVEQRETLSFSDFVGNPNTFALEVRGDSMIEDHICNGDMILLEQVSHAKDGEIVVALVGGTETTLKRFYREPGDKVRLQPANASLQPIVVPASEVQIQGRLLAVMRKYK